MKLKHVGVKASTLFKNTLDFRLNRVGMGYLTNEDRTAHGPVLWVDEEHRYSHPLSLKKRATDYAFHKLSDMIPLETYLNLQADQLEDLIDGLRIGAEERAKAMPKSEPKEPSLEDILKSQTK